MRFMEVRGHHPLLSLMQVWVGSRMKMRARLRPLDATAHRQRALQLMEREMIRGVERRYR